MILNLMDRKDILHDGHGGAAERRNMKLIGTKPNETADQAIIRCANNLVKAVLASGRSIHSTSGISGLEITFYDHRKGDIVVKNILSGWEVRGKTPLKITFGPDESELVQDDAEGDE